MSEKRLIDANALKESICATCTLYPHMCLEKRGAECDWDSIYHINDAPTIDAVEVVRCEDCKHSSDMDETFSDGRAIYICNKQGRERYTIAEGYCECGERR